MSEERKLATIRQIKDVKPIENADAIELVIIDGWQCVSKKGNFKPGDLCVYFEIDSYLPIRPEFEFLRTSSFKIHPDTKEEGFRLKTVKLRGALSQGLALPIEDFKEIHERQVGKDVTELLGIKKYERSPDAIFSPQHNSDAFGPFPAFIPKTDSERIQNITDVQRELFKNHEFEVTVKLDGQSMTVYKAGEHIGVCSRNIELKDTPSNALWQVARDPKHNVLEALKNAQYGNIAIQGELIGPKVQNNPEKLAAREFRVFSIYLIDHEIYLPPESLNVFCTYHNLLQVPRIGYSHIFLMPLEQLLEQAEGDSLTPGVKREGIVCKRGKTHIKVISNSYLLKGK